MTGANARKRARRALPLTLQSGMQGNGGRPGANNGHPDIAPDRSSIHEAAGRSGYQGSQRHKSHFKFDQSKYENHKIGW